MFLAIHFWPSVAQWSVPYLPTRLRAILRDKVTHGEALPAAYLTASRFFIGISNASRSAFRSEYRFEIVLNPLLTFLGCQAEWDADTLRFSRCIGQPGHKDAGWRRVIVSVLLRRRFRLFGAHVLLCLRPVVHTSCNETLSRFPSEK